MSEEKETIKEEVVCSNRGNSMYGEEVRRVKVFGGWSVATYTFFPTLDANGGPTGVYRSVSAIFVPDGNHDWKLK